MAAPAMLSAMTTGPETLRMYLQKCERTISELRTCRGHTCRVMRALREALFLGQKVGPCPRCKDVLRRE